MLATPGHPESNPEQAQSLLREVLAQTELLTPAEISLATIHLNSVERMIVANAEARSPASLELARGTHRRTGSQPAPGQRRGRESTAAPRTRSGRDKLEAITSIERSIREQE